MAHQTDSESAHSTPSSPSTTITSTQTDPNPDNSLDDIFGSSPTERDLNLSHTSQNADASEPSDLPSLRRQHVTAGYRDGTAASKGAHVQNGFDAGFPVGAQMGMRAGTVLGIMEGLLRGFEERSGPGVVKKPGVRGTAESTDKDGVDGLQREKREQIRTLYEAALKELDVRAVFAEVESKPADGEEEEKAERLLAQRGEGVLAKWEGRVDVPRWEENMEALEMEREKTEDAVQRG
ncbi:uncharacterized protein N7515_007972 [Penicillium bovifimosum]|uniref:Protein YAE1 n=1 Tax=Penicillium bovifimosum TaxID=126998 RepID=A0A9W9GMG1_9EURO|nr:uncharacterized protein N7515_007972 [Penicillium bovifimosum]KAJ5124147.1 hypothetical protein N7515_007972 [Penicillium bovifimosum]